MAAQPNQGFIFAAPAAIEIRRRPCCPVDVATHTVAVYRAGGGADPGTTMLPSGCSRTWRRSETPNVAL